MRSKEEILSAGNASKWILHANIINPFSRKGEVKFAKNDAKELGMNKAALMETELKPFKKRAPLISKIVESLLWQIVIVNL